MVLISIISIGAVSAVDDNDIGTGVLETTDDLSVDSVSTDDDLDDSGLVDESFDSSADAVSVDDDYGENDIVDESADLSEDEKIKNHLTALEFDEFSSDPDILHVKYITVNESNFNQYIDTDGSLKTNRNLRFVGTFSNWLYPFNTFVFNRSVYFDMRSATFNGFSFNLTSPNIHLIGGTYTTDWEMSVDDKLMSIMANNISISNCNCMIYPAHESNFIGFDVINANNTALKNNIIKYDMITLLYQNYYNYVIRLLNSCNATLQNNTINATLPFKSVNFNVTFPNIATDMVAGIAIQSSHGFKLLNNSISITGRAFSDYYPTLDTIIIVQSNNGIISGNIINETDTNYDTSDNYLYGIDLYELSNVTVSNNKITMYSIGGVVNPLGGGAAYPIQITGPVSDIFIHGNNLTTENNGPNVGIYSQNYYGQTNITIYNNSINVSGKAGDNYYSLVSGMELQDTYAEVYNNTINVEDRNNYSATSYVYGISYNQTTNSNHTFNIYDNTITTNGHYAVFLVSSNSSVVNHNFLETHDLCCNNAVYAPTANITNNYCSCPNCNCTSTNCNCNHNRGSSDNKNKKQGILGAVNDEILTDDAPQTIELYVGPNDGDGDGTLENPYANVILAWGEYVQKLDINSLTNIIIYFDEGTYHYNWDDDTDLIYYNEYDMNYDTYYLLVNENCNITFRPIEGKVVNFEFDEYAGLPFEFSDFVGLKLLNVNFIMNYAVNLPSGSKISYENCTFKNIDFSDGWFPIDEQIIGCTFDNGIIKFSIDGNSELVAINYCTFYNLNDVINVTYFNEPSRLYNANYNWWGSNNPQFYPILYPGSPSETTFDLSSKFNYTIFAVYNTTANYIGDNQWEVIGKLTWNDGTTEGIERLYDMPVSLSSTTGTFNETNPILKDGIFKVTYTSDNVVHEINALCDKENQTLSFVKTFDVGVIADNITYGDYANVTVTVSDSVDAMINVTVNEQTYSAKADTCVIVPIFELLDVGTYTVDVVLFDAENNILGSNSTTFEVKKAEPANDTPVTPTKLATKLSAPKVTATYNVAKKLVITLKDANGKVLANKKVTVKVGSISKTLKTNAKGQVSLNVAKLVPKTYTATVKFAGDSNYAASTLKPKVVVKKAKVKLAAKAKTFKAKVKTKKYTVTLKNNKGKVLKKVKLTLKIGKKTYKAKTNSKGKATFKITKLTKKGKKTATVKFAGSKYYKALSKKVKITIK